MKKRPLRRYSLLSETPLGWGAIIGLSGIALLFVMPFIWQILTSFKPGHGSDPAFWPERFVFANYAEVFRQVPYGRYLFNSLAITLTVTVLQVLISAMAAFAFSRLQWKGRDRIFMIYLASLMVPAGVLTIPSFWIVLRIGLYDTYAGLILPFLFNAFGVFLLRQFMLGIPKSLEEAALLDGAGEWTLFWDIALPLIKPGLVTLAMFTFLAEYMAYFWPLILIKDPALRTLPIGLGYFDTVYGTQMNLLMAGVVISIIPLIIVFLALQKQIVRGLSEGAVKG